MQNPRNPRPYYPNPAPIFTPLTPAHWENYAHLHHTAHHLNTSGYLPPNITVHTTNLYPHTNPATTTQTLTAALAAGYLTYSTATIPTGPLKGTQAAYELTTPTYLYGHPTLEALHPGYWKLPAALTKDDSLASQSLRVFTNTHHLIHLAHQHHITNGVLPAALASAPAVPGEPPLNESMELYELIAQGTVTPLPNGAYRLNPWHHVETARAICTGAITAPTPAPSQLEHLLTGATPPGNPTAAPLAAEQFGYLPADLEAPTGPLSPARAPARA